MRRKNQLLSLFFLLFSFFALASNDSKGPTELLLEASKAGDLAQVEQAYAAGGNLEGLGEFQLDTESDYEFTPLILAAREGHIKVVQFLLANGADVNAKQKTNFLNVANFNFHKALRELEEACGIESSAAKINRGWNPLLTAVRKERVEIVKILLEHHADVEAKTSGGWNALGFAAAQGNLEMVQDLLNHKANMMPKKVKEPFLMACLTDKSQSILEVFLSRGMDVDYQNHLGITALHLIAASDLNNEALSTVEFLLAKGADVNIKDIDGSTALHHAARAGNQSLVKVLIENNANVDERDILRRTPLHHAILQGNSLCVQTLLSAGASTTKRGHKNSNAWDLAYKKNKKMLPYLKGYPKNRVEKFFMKK